MHAYPYLSTSLYHSSCKVTMHVCSYVASRLFKKFYRTQIFLNISAHLWLNYLKPKVLHHFFIHCILFFARIDTYMNAFWFAFIWRTCIDNNPLWFSLIQFDTFYLLSSVEQTCKLGFFCVIIPELFIFCVLVIYVFKGTTWKLSLIIQLSSCIAR